MILDRKHIISWTFFDFANSSYSAVIAAVVFPVFFAQTIVGNEAGRGDLWWGWAISLSMAFVAFTSPLMGGIADYGGGRKKFLFIYTALSIGAIASLSILEKGMVMEGFLLIVIANIGMEGGLVFYNSFLPRIAPRHYQGRVSAWGYMVGYAGSIISLLCALFDHLTPLRALSHHTRVLFRHMGFYCLFFWTFLGARLFIPSRGQRGKDLVPPRGKKGDSLFDAYPGRNMEKEGTQEVSDCVPHL
jgi:MFS-type transporter involved in bile tolerance (Atg22 family)